MQGEEPLVGEGGVGEIEGDEGAAVVRDQCEDWVGANVMTEGEIDVF